MTPDRLVFAYNANAGLAAGLFDSVHKIVSPSTYPCSLCALTHGLTRMGPRWRAWLAALPVPPIFHHRPDFRAAFPASADWPLPLVATERDGVLTLVLGAEALNRLSDSATLIAAIEAGLHGGTSVAAPVPRA